MTKGRGWRWALPPPDTLTAFCFPPSISEHAENSSDWFRFLQRPQPMGEAFGWAGRSQTLEIGFAGLYNGRKGPGNLRKRDRFFFPSAKTTAFLLRECVIFTFIIPFFCAVIFFPFFVVDMRSCVHIFFLLFLFFYFTLPSISFSVSFKRGYNFFVCFDAIFALLLCSCPSDYYFI